MADSHDLSGAELVRVRDWFRAVLIAQERRASFVVPWSTAFHDPGLDPYAFLQFACAVVLDQPIVIIAPTGAPLSATLLRIGAVVEYYDEDGDEEVAMRAAAVRALQRLPPPYATTRKGQ